MRCPANRWLLALLLAGLPAAAEDVAPPPKPEPQVEPVPVAEPKPGDGDMSKAQAERKKYPGYSIARLFDLGGTPTGWWFMHGMPWPVDELEKRDCKEVFAEAARRLKAEKPAHLFDAVFSAYVLRELKLEERQKLYAECWPKLSESVRDEIAIDAEQHPREEFDGIMLERLRRNMQEAAAGAGGEGDNPLPALSLAEAAQCAAYFKRRPHAEATPLLQKLYDRLQDKAFVAKLPQRMGSGGFPYSDAPASVWSPESLEETCRKALGIAKPPAEVRLGAGPAGADGKPGAGLRLSLRELDRAPAPQKPLDAKRARELAAALAKSAEENAEAAAREVDQARELLLGGEAVREALAQAIEAAPEKSAERERLTALLDALGAVAIRRVLLDPARRVLDFKNKKPEDAVKRVAKAFGHEIEFNVYPEHEELLRATRVSIAKRNLTLGEAVAELCNQAQLGVYGNFEYLITNTDPVEDPEYASGALGLVVSISMSLMAMPKDRDVDLFFSLAGAHRFYEFDGERYEVERVQLGEETLADDQIEPSFEGSLTSVPRKAVEKAGGRIRALAGRALVPVPARVHVEDFALAEGKTERGGARLEVVVRDKTDTGWYLKFRMERTAEEECPRGWLEVLDKDGRTLAGSAVTPPGEWWVFGGKWKNTGGELIFPAKPERLRWTCVTETEEVEIPFRFSDLRVPLKKAEAPAVPAPSPPNDK